MRTRRYGTISQGLRLDPYRAKLGGVCAGIARHLGADPLVVRCIALLALWFLPHVTLIAYGIAWMVLKQD